MSADQTHLAAIPVPQSAQSCAIVVAYYPDADFPKRIEAICAQFPTIVVIDNTPEASALGALPSVVYVIRNERNLGVATALNQGLHWAANRQCTWAASFDQDTEIFPTYLNAVMEAAKKNGHDPVLVGANYTDCRLVQPSHLAQSNDERTVPRLTLISSGTYMPVLFALDIGGFRDDYFIDSVDHEFCLRAKRHGARVLMTIQPHMCHRMGLAAAGWGIPLSWQHAPSRRYYIARNTLATIRANAWRHPLWSLRQIGRLTAECFAIITLEEQRMPKLRAFLQGLWHGFVGKSGMHG
jgi:rhamnosyltransferase